jgi:hypothetical protein
MIIGIITLYEFLLNTYLSEIAIHKDTSLCRFFKRKVIDNFMNGMPVKRIFHDEIPIDSSVSETDCLTSIETLYDISIYDIGFMHPNKMSRFCNKFRFADSIV